MPSKGQIKVVTASSPTPSSGLWISVLPAPLLYSSGEGHGGGVGSQGSPAGGRDSHCLIESAEWAWSCLKCGFPDFPVPPREFSKGKGIVGIGRSHLAGRRVMAICHRLSKGPSFPPFGEHQSLCQSAPGDAGTWSSVVSTLQHGDLRAQGVQTLPAGTPSPPSRWRNIIVLNCFLFSPWLGK